MLSVKLENIDSDLIETYTQHYTGWIPPLPDLRDYVERDINGFATQLNIPSKTSLSTLTGVSFELKLPEKVDLEEWCSPVKKQLNLGSCCAQAAVSAVEYYQQRAYGTHEKGSTLFVYKAMRNLMKVTGDTGGYLRTVMASLRLFGLPQEYYWPYDVNKFDIEPSAFLYSIADNYEAIKYFAHDSVTKTRNPNLTLESVKKYLAAGIPSIFGTFLYPSYNNNADGSIPFPDANEKLSGGHALLAVGYDDTKKIVNLYKNRKIETIGAIKFKNSWGKEWGTNGYGWLPYKYIQTGLANDFWSILNMDWIDTGNFGLNI